MKKKIIGILVCTLLIAATAFSVAGTEIVDENEGSHCGLATALANCDLWNYHIQTEEGGGLDGRGVPFYAYNAWDPSGVLVEGPVKFDPATPGSITQLAATTSTDFISGGTWTNDGTWYGCEYGIYGNRNIWTINNATGAMTLVGSYDPGGTGLSFNGLAYDPTTDTMYGCSDTDLYTVNMSTGASTGIGSFGLSLPSYMIGIAFDDAGNLYGDELQTDSLYQINPSTGAAGLIGSLGININGGQDMAYDIDIGTLYLSAFTVSPVFEGALYTCNTSTGVATKVGTFQGAAQITGFAIPYGETADTTPPTTTHQFTPATPDGDNGWYVSSVIVTLTATDAESGVAWTNYSLDNGVTWTTHTGPWPFNFVVGDGEYQLKYYSVDNVGNVESTKGPFALKVDTTKSTTTHTLDPPAPDGLNGWYVSDVTVTFTATDTGSGVASTKYSLNNGATWTTHTGPWPFDVIVSDCKHELLYYSVDNAGNVEPTNGPFDFDVDTTKPQIHFFSFPIVFGPYLAWVINFGFVKDGCSGLDRMEFLLNGVFHHQEDLSWWPGGMWRFVSWFYRGPGGGGDTCSAIVYDRAGNWG